MPSCLVVTEAGVASPLFQPAPELCAVPEVEPLASRVGSRPAACSSFGAGVSPQCVSPAPLKEAEPSCLCLKRSRPTFSSRAWSRGRACFARGTAGDAPPTVPCFLDVLSGPRFPLARAFSWAGWRVVTPIDLLIDKDFDINSAAVRAAIFHVLPQVHLLSCAVACNTKSRAREISRPGMSLPKPLRSAQHPRGLPDLQPKDAAQVAQDNEASDFQLALQQAVGPSARTHGAAGTGRIQWKRPFRAGRMSTMMHAAFRVPDASRRKSGITCLNLPCCPAQFVAIPTPQMSGNPPPLMVPPSFPLKMKLSIQLVSSSLSWFVPATGLLSEASRCPSCIVSPPWRLLATVPTGFSSLPLHFGRTLCCPLQFLWASLGNQLAPLRHPHGCSSLMLPLLSMVSLPSCRQTLSTLGMAISLIGWPLAAGRPPLRLASMVQPLKR